MKSSIDIGLSFLIFVCFVFFNLIWQFFYYRNSFLTIYFEMKFLFFRLLLFIYISSKFYSLFVRLKQLIFFVTWNNYGFAMQVVFILLWYHLDVERNTLKIDFLFLFVALHVCFLLFCCFFWIILGCLFRC